MPRGRRDSPHMNALAFLIRERMTDKDWSTYDVEKKGGPPARTVAHLADPNVQWKVTPRPGTLEKLAYALELPLKEIQHAAAQAVAGGTGKEPEGSQYIDRVAAAMQELPEQRQAQIAEFVARMIDTWQEETPAPLRSVAKKKQK